MTAAQKTAGTSWGHIMACGHFKLHHLPEFDPLPWHAILDREGTAELKCYTTEKARSKTSLLVLVEYGGLGSGCNNL